MVRRVTMRLGSAALIVIGAMGVGVAQPEVVEEVTEAAEELVEEAPEVVEEDSSSDSQLAPSDQELREVLDQKLSRHVRIEYEGVMLRDVVTHLAGEIDADVLFDNQTIEEEGLSVEESVAFAIRHTPISVREGLERLLEPYQLVAVNDDGLLRVTTQTAAEDMTYLVAYDVADLLRGLKNEERDGSATTGLVPKNDLSNERGHFTMSDERTGRGSIVAQVDMEHLGSVQAKYVSPIRQLVALIQTSSAGPWWTIDGSGGTIEPIGEQLVVRQTDVIHREVREILKQLRENVAARGSDGE